MNYYCTLDEARSELIATSATTPNNRLLRHIKQVSRRIDMIMSGRSNVPFFMPHIATYYVPITSRRVSSQKNSLLLKGFPPLLALTTVVTGGSDITSTVEGSPQGEVPITELRITSSGACSWYTYACASDPVYAAIAGVWGYHSDYANAWLRVDNLQAQQLENASSFTVADIDGADPYGITPRLSPGALVKIESEYELVTATDEGTNVATSSRAQNGSAAALHANGSAVYWWQVEEPIKRITARQAGLLEARRGAYQVETIDNVGAISYPQDLLTELKNVLTSYINQVA